MLNATCNFEYSFHITVIYHTFSFFSMTIYCLAFFVLIFKCPTVFRDYRNCLAAHVASGFILDVYIGFIWNLHIPLPWAAICSNGFAGEFAQHLFQSFIFVALPTGLTAVYLLIFQMKTATRHAEKTTLRASVFWLNYVVWAGAAVLSVLTVLIYADLKRQDDYKRRMEEKTGQFPAYIWCDNCFFMRFDSTLFIAFFCAAYFDVFAALFTGCCAIIESFRSLQSLSIRFSGWIMKTAAIQKHFLSSLVVSITIHFSLFVIPVGSFLAANFVKFSEREELMEYLIVVLKEHGAVSTLAILLCNKLLRRCLLQLCGFQKVARVSSEIQHRESGNVDN